jgi:spore coat polysaccharide biosynthesis protein SpsF
VTTAVVVQARVASTRLPRKVLAPLAGAPLLARVVERVRAAPASSPFELVVATTVDPADDAVERLCRDLEVRCFRGHPTDLLDRHVAAARTLGADVVVKIPSDCPLVDPAAVALVLTAWDAAGGRLDYISNLHPPSWPDGNDVEVMSLAALEQASREARAPHEREHTTPFLWDEPGRFRVGNVVRAGGRDLSMTHRFTVDWPEDLAFVSAVYDALLPARGPAFGVEAILDLLAWRPEIHALNARFLGVNWYRHHLDVLRTVGAPDTRPAPAEETSP